MISREIIANMNTDSDYKAWMEQINSTRNYETPFGVNSKVNNNQPSAQEMANSYMLMKQRRPFVMEYYLKSTDQNPKSITMYINPERMQISNQKIIGKQITKGGIFYHHYGSDHSTMTFNGTTGLAGMAGIKQLEEIYYASGTLLRYNNFMPVQIYGNVDSYNVIDYKDPVAVIENVVNNNYSNNTILEIQQKLWNEHKNDTELNQIYNSLALLDLYKQNNEFNNFVSTNLPKIYSDVTTWDQKNQFIHYRKFYQKIIDLIQKEMPNLDKQIIVNMAYELSLNKIYSDLPIEDKTRLIENTKKDTVTNVVAFQKARSQALKDHIKQLKSFEQREKKIRDILKSGLINIKDELTDPWLPRQITIYFENRAYIGHFDSFSYNRDSKTNLINYEMRFTITKQYEFNNEADGAIPPTVETISVETNIINQSPSLTVQKQNDSPPPKPNKNIYTVISGDTLRIIAQKFYGNGDYWPEIYAENLSIINDPELIFPGQQFVIPPYPSGYRRWVVLSGDNLSALARRFYGNETKWRTIYDANKNIIKDPNLIYPKQILKIPI